MYFVLVRVSCSWRFLRACQFSNYSDFNFFSVFKFCVIGGIFLTWFADALLFDMMIRTEYKDGVNTIQNLIDRGMLIGKIELIKINAERKFGFSYVAWQ